MPTITERIYVFLEKSEAKFDETFIKINFILLPLIIEMFTNSFYYT